MPNPPAHLLSLESLPKIDRGKVAVAFDAAIFRCVEDCKDRVGDETPRTVELKIEFMPVMDKDTGRLDTIDVRFKIKDVLPKRQTVAYPMLPKAAGIMFNPESPLDPRQSTFGFDAESGEVPLDGEAADDARN